MIDYVIVVPSRKRSHNMPMLVELLPSAMICIDEREVEDYKPYVPADKLLVHPPLTGGAYVRNWILDNVEAEAVVMLDDDFSGIHCNTGSKRFLTDSEEILAIIENGAITCADLGLTTFCWSRTPNTTIIHPDWRPVVPIQFVFGAFGLMGDALKRRYRTDMPGRADVDWTLQTLLHDRCVIADVRYYFDFGQVFSGRGGNVGLVTPDDFLRGSKLLKKTWGNSFSFKTSPWVKKVNSTACSLKVTRTNKAAQK